MKRTVSISEKHLRKFKKINLQPGEEKIVAFTLNSDDLGLWNKSIEFVVEPGEFEIMIGNTTKNTRVKKLFLVYRDKKAK